MLATALPMVEDDAAVVAVVKTCVLLDHERV